MTGDGGGPDGPFPIHRSAFPTDDFPPTHDLPTPLRRTGARRPGALVVLLAALVAVPALAPQAQAQRAASDGVVRGYVPADELVSFPASTPMNQFLRLVNPTFFRVTGKRVVDPQDRTDPIGVSLSGVHFIDAFELVLDRHTLDFTESDSYFIVTEPSSWPRRPTAARRA